MNKRRRKKRDKKIQGILEKTFDNHFNGWILESLGLEKKHKRLAQAFGINKPLERRWNATHLDDQVRNHLSQRRFSKRRR